MKINEGIMLWAHDCIDCEYDCTIESGTHFYDVYFCKKGVLGETVVARFGDQGHDYISIPSVILEQYCRWEGLFKILCDIQATRTRKVEK